MKYGVLGTGSVAEYDALGIQACQIMFMSKGNFNQVYSNFQSIT